MERFLGKIDNKKITVVSNSSKLKPSTSSRTHEDESHESAEDNNGLLVSCEDEDYEADDDIHRTPEKNVTTKRFYKQKHRKEWELEFKWLTFSKEQSGSFCKACNKVLTSKYGLLKRHEGTDQHKKNLEKMSKTLTLDEFVTGEFLTKEKQIKKSELKCVIFLHEHNLPLSLMEHLPKFLTSVCPDSEIAKEIKCSRTKATEITNIYLAVEDKRIIKENLSNNFYSLIIDETTDLSTQKSLAVLIRFWSNNFFDVRDSFLGLIRLAECNAESICNVTINLLKETGVDTANLIGFAADNAAVMMGNRAGVQAKLKAINPSIFVLGCSCHSFNLCCNAAVEKLPRSVEELAKSIFNHFSNSSYKAESLAEFQTFTNIKPCKMLHPSQTRWLSLQAVVDRILKSWDALNLYFIHAVEIDNDKSSINIMQCLKNPIYKAYFLFLSYILSLINHLNLEFQAEETRIHALHSKITSVYKQILKNFIVKSKIDDEGLNIAHPANFLPLNEVYFGARVELLFTEVHDVEACEIQKFRTNCLSFYIELCQQVKRRFDFKDPILMFLNNFQPNRAVSGEVKSVVKLLHFIPKLMDSVNPEELNTEWGLVGDIPEIKILAEKNTFCNFWKALFKMKNALNEPLFPNLSICLQAIMSLPHSSAAAERIFSQVNLLKTKQRNRLLVSTVDAIIHSKQLIRDRNCFSWEPSKELLYRYRKRLNTL